MDMTVSFIRTASDCTIFNGYGACTLPSFSLQRDSALVCYIARWLLRSLYSELTV